MTSGSVSRTLRRSGMALTLVAAPTTALLGGSVVAGAGATLIVDTLDDGAAVATDCTAPVAGSCSLRDALAAAVDGAAVVFDASLSGTITASAGTFTVARSMTITGPGPERLTVHGDGVHRVFLVADTAADVTIEALTVTGGTNDVADTTGGAGIAALNSGAFTVRNCTVSGNATKNKGAGGVLFRNGGAARVESSTIDGNSSPWWTGGLYFGGYDRSITILGSTISNNTAAGGGGGIGLWGDRNTVLIADTTIVGNRSGDYGGGGILAYDGHTISIVMSTITDNTALGDDEGRAGGFESFAADMLDHIPVPATVSIVGTILSGNHSGRAATADLGAWGTPKARITMTNSLWGAGQSFIDGGNNVQSTDAGLGPLATNGGPTRTMALLDDSLALDAGPADVPFFPGDEWDQRGPGFRRVAAGRSDIGAFERQPTIATPRFTG